MRSLLLLASLTLSVVFAGCSAPPAERLDPPVAKFDSLVANNHTVALTLRFTNVNAVPMVISQSYHKLTVGEQLIGTIDDAEAIGLPSLGTQTHAVELPAKIALAVQAYLRNHPGEVRVSVKSGLNVLTTDDNSITLTTVATGLVKNP